MMWRAARPTPVAPSAWGSTSSAWMPLRRRSSRRSVRGVRCSWPPEWFTHGMPFSRPLMSIMVVGAVLWVLSGALNRFLPDADDFDSPPGAVHDPAADGALRTLVQCLMDIEAVTGNRASALHPQAGIPNIEHWYRERCQSMLDGPRFRTYTTSYGVRAASTVRAVLEREARLVRLAVDDPQVSDADIVALWRVAAGRAAVDVQFFGRTLAEVFDGLDSLPDAPLLDLGPAEPVLER